MHHDSKRIENKIKLVQLSNLIRGLCAKQRESIGLIETKVKTSGKSDSFFCFVNMNNQTPIKWDGDKFMFNEWDYINNNQKGDELVVIVGFIRRNYVNDIYMDYGCSTCIMYKNFYKQLPIQVQRKIKPLEMHHISFFGHNVWPKRTIILPLTLVYYSN